MTTTCEHKRVKTIGDTVHCADCEPVTYMDVAETSKIIRAELKKAFPGQKFSVTCKRYSMGCSISVRYVDGPPTKSVRAITDQFCGKSFDGMTDSTEYYDSLWNGKPVHWPSYSPDVRRDLSEDKNHELHGRIERMIAARWINPDRDFLYRAAHVVMSSMDARFETADRAVNRWFAEGCVAYDR